MLNSRSKIYDLFSLEKVKEKLVDFRVNISEYRALDTKGLFRFELLFV